ncbi:DUF99 family protein [Candidatus Woesearchaeota archaeon]|nr:DUF99 family protein [Candidatus Woesearchaeota archaeon]MBW3005666.1 DUF99 family protein [Candidatus Woesearchaeota archaeon]
MRKEIRILGIDDGPFNKFKDKEVLIVGTLFRGGSFIDGVMSTKAKVDGKDSTLKITRMINKSKFKKQLRAIFLNGIAVGGFNVIDVKQLNKKTKIPVIVVIRNYPDLKKIFKALDNLKMKKQKKLIEDLPKPTKVGKIYIQHIGISLSDAKEMLKLTCTHSYIPEPIRVAHLIAAGVVKGESRGRA